MENAIVKNGLIDVHILIVFRGRWNYIFHSVGSISSIHGDVTGH